MKRKNIKNAVKKLRKMMVYNEQLGIYVRPDEDINKVKKLTKRIADDFLDEKGEFKWPKRG